jgi:hypothetical protein
MSPVHESQVAPSGAMKTHAAVGALVGWFALGLQYALMIRPAIAEGTALGTTIRFFSYFTILTNLLVAIAYSAMLRPRRDETGFFTRPAVTSGIALSIALVGIAYSLLLRHIWDPQGWQLVADHLLHDVAPLLFVAYWALWIPKRGLTASHVWRWALYPIAYFTYALVQARMTDWYPYPFLDAGEIGYAVVLRNATVILALFITAGFAMVAGARRFSRS